MDLTTTTTSHQPVSSLYAVLDCQAIPELIQSGKHESKGDWAFAMEVPTLWNNQSLWSHLPEEFRQTDSAQ